MLESHTSWRVKLTHIPMLRILSSMPKLKTGLGRYEPAGWLGSSFPSHGSRKASQDAGRVPSALHNRMDYQETINLATSVSWSNWLSRSLENGKYEQQLQWSMIAEFTEKALPFVRHLDTKSLHKDIACSSLCCVYDCWLAARINLEATYFCLQADTVFICDGSSELSFVWKSMPLFCNMHLMHWCVCMVVDWPVWGEIISIVVRLWDPFTWRIHLQGTVWFIFDRNSIVGPHHMVYALLFARSILPRLNLIWGGEKAFASSLDLPNLLPIFGFRDSSVVHSPCLSSEWHKC